jgi:hypothetical protein
VLACLLARLLACLLDGQQRKRRTSQAAHPAPFPLARPLQALGPRSPSRSGCRCRPRRRRAAPLGCHRGWGGPVGAAPRGVDQALTAGHGMWRRAGMADGHPAPRRPRQATGPCRGMPPGRPAAGSDSAASAPCTPARTHPTRPSHCLPSGKPWPAATTPLCAHLPAGQALVDRVVQLQHGHLHLRGSTVEAGRMQE